jgi:hypothetical protein
MFECWSDRTERVVLHRCADGNPGVVVSVVMGGKAWRVARGKAKEAKALALRIELACAEVSASNWHALDNASAPWSCDRWQEVAAIFDRHNATRI